MANNSKDVHLGPLTVCHSNIHSLLSHGKLTELGSLTLEENIDVVALSESWLTHCVPDQVISLSGFLPPFRCDRARPYGGVAVYVSNRLNATRLPALEFDGIESVWLSIDVGGKSILLGTYYRPPGQLASERDQFILRLSNSIEMAQQLKSSALFLVADFNDRCSSWHSSHDRSELGLDLYNVFLSHNLQQLIDSPTRYSPVTGTDSLLDLIVTDAPAYVSDSGVWPPIASSDHSTVFCRIKFHLEKNPSFKRHVWLYDQADIVGLNQSLINIPWYTWYDQSLNMDNVWAKWSTSFLNSCKQFIPNRDIIVRPKDKPWVDRQLKALLRRRNRL